MFINQASRIIVNLLFPDLCSYLKCKNHKNDMQFAVSSLQVCNRAFDVHHVLMIKTVLKSIHIGIALEQFSIDKQSAFNSYLQLAQQPMKKNLSLLFRKDIHLEHIHSFLPPQKLYFSIDLAIGEASNEQYIRLLIAEDFFKLFYLKINQQTTPEVIEQEILAFFKNPSRLMPDIRSLLAILSEIELQH